MLPYPQHTPPKATQLVCAVTIPVAVRGNLGFPVAPVIGGQSVASRTAVPKTAVNENCQSLGMKHKIGLSRKVSVSAPPVDSGLTQKTHEHYFRRCVAFRANARHVPRALFSRKPVRHNSPVKTHRSFISNGTSLGSAIRGCEGAQGSRFRPARCGLAAGRSERSLIWRRSE